LDDNVVAIVAEVNGFIKCLGLPNELEGLEMGIVIEDLCLDLYGKALSSIFMIASPGEKE